MSDNCTPEILFGCYSAKISGFCGKKLKKIPADLADMLRGFKINNSKLFMKL